MGSRSVTTVVTSDTMALGAAVFGFAGHSLMTPHHAIQEIWWTDERIEAKVTREFVVSKLLPSYRNQLYKPMFSGSGLTEDTYLDWIIRKGKRLFLILAECGVADRIFRLVEDAWDDNDLPIPRNEIQRLTLSYKEDISLSKKFYNNQFRYLLRPLDTQTHIDYAPNEVIPVEFVYKVAPAAALQKWSRLHLPKRPNQLYVRRKLSLGEKDEADPEMLSRLIEDVTTARSIEHEHVARICSSWSQKGTGYFMTSFIAEHNLKSFIDFRTPASMQKVKKQERQTILLEWLHCLAHALAHVHRRRFYHGAISPGNILIDETNKIAFSDIGSLESFQKDKKLDFDEVYNYGAPEFFDETKRSSPDLLRPPSPARKFFGHRRNKSSRGSSIGDISEHASTFAVDSQGNFSFKARSNSVDTITTAVTETSQHSAPSRIGLSPTTTLVEPSPPLDSTKKPPGRAPPPPPLSSLQQPENAEPDRKAGDVFSLACVYLDVISFILKRKPNEFSKHRSTKRKNANGKGSFVDSSFHDNHQKVLSWIEILEKDLPSTQEQPLLALPPLFRLIGEMLNPEPHRRPSAYEVQERVFDALISHGGLALTHCTNTVPSPSVVSSPSSIAPTSISGGSRPSLSMISTPRIAAFPPLFSPPVPSKSPRRPSMSGALTEKRLQAPVPQTPQSPRRDVTKQWVTASMTNPFGGVIST